MEFVNLFEAEAAARERLPEPVYGYFAGGAQDEITLIGNRRAYEELALLPRVLVDVATRDLRTTLLGRTVAAPIAVAPMAMQRLAHPDGELAAARAASAAELPMGLSTIATTTLEDVRSATTAPLWFQLYVYKDRGVTRGLVERAETAGCDALLLTVDAPLLGRRERDVRHRFLPPPGIRAMNVHGGVAPAIAVPDDSALSAYFHQAIDPALTWRDVEWLRTISRLPVVLKGVARADDVVRAADHGAAAVIVSNHGGRQLDTALPSLLALPAVVAAAGERMEVYVDGGIRRGTDVLKALALGARAVLVGRPVLWGLVLGGEAGVARVLALLRDELDLAMALCGCPRLGDITADLVVSRSAASR